LHEPRQHGNNSLEQFLACQSLATSASNAAAHSVADPRASSKNFDLICLCLFPLPSAVLKRIESDARSRWSHTSRLLVAAGAFEMTSKRSVTQATNFHFVNIEPFVVEHA